MGCSEKEKKQLYKLQLTYQADDQVWLEEDGAGMQNPLRTTNPEGHRASGIFMHQGQSIYSRHWNIDLESDYKMAF